MIGDVLLYGALSGCTVALILGFLVCIRGRYELEFLHSVMLRVVFVLLFLSLLLLIYYFISDNFSVYYVWSYSNRDMPLFYKTVAVWAGQQGTFLLWACLSSLSLLWLSQREGVFAQRTLLLSEPVLLLLVLLTVFTQPFKLMSEFPHLGGAMIENGAGIDPELLNPWMGLHPPLTFLAYATILIPSAAAASHLLWRETDTEEWRLFVHKMARISWLFFSLGVGLIGGLWTYEAGWGIWTWDASEAGSLVPWLLLTASLHQKHSKPMMAALLIFTFVSVLFAAFIIRSGLWGSVHEFTETSINQVLGAAIAVSSIAAIWLVYRNRQGFRLQASPINSGAAVMVLLSIVVFTGLAIPLVSRASGEEVSVGAEFYNLTCYPLALLLLILLGVNIFGTRGRSAGVIVALLSILFSFIKPSPEYGLLDQTSSFYLHSSPITQAYGSLSLLSMLPPVIFAFIAVLVWMRRQNRTALLHLGMVLLFFFGVFSTALSEEHTAVFRVEDVGRSRVAGEYDVRLSGFHVEQNPRGNWVQHASVEVARGGKRLGETTASYVRDNTGGGYAISGIIRKPLYDLFITFQGLEPRQDAPPVIPLNIKVYPVLSVFWIGDFLLSLSMFLMIIKNNN